MAEATPGRPTALVVSMSWLDRDPRVERQISALKTSCAVVTAGFSPSSDRGLRHVALRVPRLSEVLQVRRPVAALRLLAAQSLSRVAMVATGGRDGHSALAETYFRSPTWSRWRCQLSSVRADVVIVNDALMLPVAFRLPDHPAVVFDAHEHAESQEAESLRWRLVHRPVVRYIQGRYLPRVAGMMSVSPGIARRYEGATGVGSRVVTNAPGLVDLVPRSVDPQRIRVVHFGVAHPQRRLDLTIEAVGSLDERFSLDLFLVGREDRLEEVRRWAARYPRVRVLPAVAMGDLTRVANGYDVGVHLLPLPIFNHRYALPNKFFEYVQGRLAVAIGPSVEMARIADEWGFGLVADDFTAAALARVIGEAGAQRIWECKQASHRAAQVLNAEANAAIITDLVHHALSSERRASQ